MDLGIDGNTAIVTASSGGLGKASARALIREGANVVVNGRNEEKLEGAVAELEDAGPGQVVGQSGDITVSNVNERLVDRALEEFGRLDHLVTSAGGPPSGQFLETSEEAWYEAYDLLLMSVVKLVNAAAEPLMDGDGTIVHITSRAVKEAVEGNPLTSSVRMGVIGLEKYLSRELAPSVRVNAVLPGAHETERLKELATQKIEQGRIESYEEDIAARTENIPLNRLGRPIELGNTVAFLSSPTSGFINGTTVTIDGGRTRATL